MSWSGLATSFSVFSHGFSSKGVMAGRLAGERVSVAVMITVTVAITVFREQWLLWLLRLLWLCLTEDKGSRH